MPKSMNVLILVALALVVVAVAFQALRAGLGQDRECRYSSTSLLTANELEFFHRLKRALPGFEILTQVAMGALLTPAVPRNSRDYMRIRGTFAQKYVDFVICDPRTMDVVALVELDDRTHSSEKDARRDAMLAAAGYRVVRWQSKKKPAEPEIRSAMAALTRPPCLAS